ncbi:MAG: hypothetical protein A2945_03985 [Candidatus Liptonbacteria bacterium RIFCSPLOWO2_01_FULL_52_25]|uniref:Stress-response A/B barrel domain-containing protein n=1 Tax=Candidatus Liptonbacteria bacterium RIFCSPLOWO2_01_FULL_52_25 TaxID=1798650 RepID=A0A1G2CCM3_9BACT|nr:MAG: hypothetical protein A2945_03985 [Candidatus Liptonbacteria bacterium RIFCSPLOWO2_01_FULL_52_25]
MQPTGRLTGTTTGVPLFTYHEDGFQSIEKTWLTDEEYEKVLRSKVLACTDVVFVNRRKRTFYLAWRKALPMTGWFWMGGNRGGINAPLTKGLVAVILDETKLTTITPDRLILRGLMEYFWKDRAQAPQHLGCHMLGLTFSADITEDEARAITLDPKEYGEDELREFTREDLVRERVFPNVIDMYDLVFPPANLWHAVLISFKPDTPEEIRRDIYDRYQTMDADCGGKDAGVLFWKVDRNLDPRKNVHLVEIAVFRDMNALQTFRNHPKHKELTNILSKVADWQVGDINHPIAMP